MPKNVLIDKLKKMNQTGASCDKNENEFVRSNVIKVADEIYKNPTKTKKKFQMIANYQQTFKALQKQNYVLDYSAHHDKEILEIIKKDKSAIREFNNANYKFPLYKTAHENVFEIDLQPMRVQRHPVNQLHSEKVSLRSKLHI